MIIDDDLKLAIESAVNKHIAKKMLKRGKTASNKKVIVKFEISVTIKEISDISDLSEKIV